MEDNQENSIPGQNNNHNYATPKCSFFSRNPCLYIVKKWLIYIRYIGNVIKEQSMDLQKRGNSQKQRTDISAEY